MFLELLEELETVSETGSNAGNTGAAVSQDTEEKQQQSAEPETVLETVETASETPEKKSEYSQNISEYSENSPETVYSCTAAESFSVIMEAPDLLYEQVKQKINEGREGYDSSLTLNRLMKLESIGYAKARRVMDRLG